MNLTLHLVRKDWLRARPALVAWYALIAGKAWFVWQLTRSTDTSSDLAALGTAVTLLNALETVTGALLAAWLALEDPAHSPTAFWATRPIGRSRLLRAKSLGAFLFFIAAPLLLLAPVWLAAGFSAPEFFAAATDWALMQGFAVALGLLAGVLSRDLGQIFLGAPLLGLTVLGVANWLGRNPAPPAWQSMALGLTVAVIGIALAYALHRRSPALAVVVAGLLLVASCGLPKLPPDEHLSAWPEPTRALQVGEAHSAASRTWRFVALDYDEGGRPSILLQSARSWISLRPAPQHHEAAPHFTIIDPAAGQPLDLDPKRLGTVHAASLHVSRWQLVPPYKLKVPAGGIRLFAAPPPALASQP
jgi:hypothetical protein